MRGEITAHFSRHIDLNHLNPTKIVRWLIFTVGEVTILGF